MWSSTVRFLSTKPHDLSSLTFSSSNLKGSSSSFILVTCEMLVKFLRDAFLLKQLFTVLADTASHNLTNMRMASRMLIFGVVLPHQCIWSDASQHLCDKKPSMPWLLPDPLVEFYEVVLGGKNTNSIALRLLTLGWVGDLSMINMEFRVKSSRIIIQDSILDLCWQGSFLTPLKPCGFSAFPITNMGSFSPTPLPAARPVKRTLLSLPHTHHTPFRWK